jgi:glycogen debranching enzyme
LSHIIRVEDQYYILATSSLADDRTRVLKHGDTFAVFDRYGDIQPVGLGEQGLYHEETRFLSSLRLYLGDERPLLLSSSVREDNGLLVVDLTNPDIFADGRVTVPRGALHILRSKFLWRGACYEEFRITNYALFPIEFSFQLEVGADFADLFEVRGMRRPRRGRKLEPKVVEDGLVLSYEGLDGVIRNTRLECRPVPRQVTPSSFDFAASLQSRSEAVFYVTTSCASAGAAPERSSFGLAAASAAHALASERERDCMVYSSNEQFNEWFNRSLADLHMMISETPHGIYPYAGVPWFSTIFGRDGIITALQCLWINPDIARGVLSHLAATQATAEDAAQDAQPGKILHETRKGEMAALGEIPFGRYYGSIDSTPLFVLLAGAYYRRSGDLEFIGALWRHIEAAIEWIERYGDEDGDGFVEYRRRSPKGLTHQGWKDSNDAVFHADGSLAEGPIALCEVQGYVYEAYRGAAVIAGALGHSERAAELRKKRAAAGERFRDEFWCEELSTYVLALDGAKRPCRVRSSNPGHCLFTGIATRSQARRVAAGLFGDGMYSGWGVRTVSAEERRYDPMSYHNGSIWPHDNALIALGLARYGLKDLVLRLFSGLFDVSLFMELHRLPELFCGFPRRPGEGPTLYPVACAPQAWAAGAVFSFLQAALGLEIDAHHSRIRFCRPRLPPFLRRLKLANLRVGPAEVDLLIRRHGDDVGTTVLRRKGHVELMIVK